ncbi:MAG: imidazolonepropionase [Phycisphaerae bacterium]
MPSELLIKNIGELVLIPQGPVPGPAMGDVPVKQDAWLQVSDGKIAAFGSSQECPPVGDMQVVDAMQGCVIPGLIDCHTHTVFAGTREREFVRRIEGASYVQIAEEGGGIRTSVASVRQASLDELVAMAQPRLRRMLSRGVTTVEIKSGYGLTVDDELKMLRAAKQAGEELPIEVVGTYLAAHTIPAEYDGRPDDYLDLVLADDVLQELKNSQLAEFSDVFCERSAFDVSQSRRVMETCGRHGLRGKVHADQITQMGASRLAAETGAISADHLEEIDEGGLAAMNETGVMAVLLPGCSFFLGVGQAPARKIMDAGLPVAVATDFNPGSAMVESLPLVMGIAVTQMRMTPTETLVAATANAAAALGRADRLGAIQIGMQADLVILDIPNHLRMAYELGRDTARVVIKDGEVVYDRQAD